MSSPSPPIFIFRGFLLTYSSNYAILCLLIQFFPQENKENKANKMSITIFPVGNFEFCETNNLVDIIKEDCLCVSDTRNNCHYCNGSGEYSTEIYPCEMNISNGNFKTLWNALGLDFDYCGEICPKKILDSLRILDENLLLRANFVLSNDSGDANFISFGIDKEQALRYTKRLREIAMHAISRGVNICWG